MSKMLCIGSQVLAQENIQGQIPGHNTNDKETPCPAFVLSLVGYVLRRPGGLVAKLIACLDTETVA